MSYSNLIATAYERVTDLSDEDARKVQYCVDQIESGTRESGDETLLADTLRRLVR